MPSALTGPVISPEGKEKGADCSAPVTFRFKDCSDADQAPAALLNEAYRSLPTKPNFVTPEPLMMFSTRAEMS